MKDLNTMISYIEQNAHIDADVKAACISALRIVHKEPSTEMERVLTLTVDTIVHNDILSSAVCSHIQQHHHKWCVDHPTCDNCVREFLNKSIES